MTERRRVPGPNGLTTLPQYRESDDTVILSAPKQDIDGLPAVYIRTGISPSASGSAYLEIEQKYGDSQAPLSLGMKLICIVHGPRSLPRTAPFSHFTILATYSKCTPFASPGRNCPGDMTDKDLSAQLEVALRGAVINDRSPKSGVAVVVTVIESSDRSGHDLLDGCVTVATAAIVDAGIDCIDMISVGAGPMSHDIYRLPDPIARKSEEQKYRQAGYVTALPNRDEVLAIWLKGL
ncbi:hypothetical protein L249_5655 [Ophiocordyceps polyrhachis-furcata BCC 54312]|uniref:Exoribonuclease phosphorolytic domain-containing protein n=1 Tax=Ophiocordyceps polyrhachis-furcata BCC 54312 TaxID=1330021 RepID=A0A367LG97_9HYPO|nr:hypothetical protein L249_5655 [Ophiocordyceps polyrhachis-furcata BCC 54312]